MVMSLIKNNQPELLLLLSILQADTNIVSPPNIDWQLFYKLVIRHRIWHQVHKALPETNTPIFPWITKRC